MTANDLAALQRLGYEAGQQADRLRRAGRLPAAGKKLDLRAELEQVTQRQATLAGELALLVAHVGVTS